MDLHAQFYEWLRERNLIETNGGFLTPQPWKFTEFQLSRRQDINEIARRHRVSILQGRRTPTKGGPAASPHVAELFPSLPPPPQPTRMKITIISLNVQGLNDINKIGLARNYIRPLLANSEILCF